jgi:hypothetical protein
VAGAGGIEHGDFQLGAFWQRSQKIGCIVFVAGDLSLRGRRPRQLDERLVVDLIADLNLARARRAPGSFRANLKFGALSATANNKRGWRVFHAGGYAHRRGDQRGVIYR